MITDKIVIWGDDDKELLRSFKRYVKFVIGCSDVKIASYRLIETNSFMGETMIVFIDSDTNDFTGWNVARNFSKIGKSVYCVFGKSSPVNMANFGDFWGSLCELELLFIFMERYVRADNYENSYECFINLENKYEQLKKSANREHLNKITLKTRAFLSE